MDKLLEAYNQLEKEVYSLQGVQKTLSFTITELEQKMNTNVDTKELSQKCIEILDVTQKLLQEKMKEGFETVSTNALQSVFGVGYNLELEFDRRGSVPEVKVYIKTPDMKKGHNPEKSNSGGSKDLIALILRMVVLGFLQPEGRTPLKLDEPFSQVGEGNIDSVGKCLKTIVKQFDRQIILITHQQKMAQFADNIIKFE